MKIYVRLLIMPVLRLQKTLINKSTRALSFNRYFFNSNYFSLFIACTILFRAFFACARISH